MESMALGVVTVSDRAYAGSYEDLSGPIVGDLLSRWIESPLHLVQRVVPDERSQIANALCELADVQQCDLIVTTGGTGPSPRDVTPEATHDVCDRMLPGFGERMRAVSVATVSTAILSRQTAGSRGRTLIVNLPGKPTSIEPCLAAIIAAVPGCIQQLGGRRLSLSASAPTRL